MSSILSQEPASGTVSYGEVLYVDDGSDPLGSVEQITGGSNSRGIPRAQVTTYDPRLLSDSVDPESYGDNADQFISEVSGSLDPGNPVQSVEDFISGNFDLYTAASSELSSDSTIQNLAQRAADRGVKPGQVLAGVIRSGIGAGVLTDAAQTAAANGLASGSGVVGVEAGAVTLVFGAIATDYDALTGDDSLSRVANHVPQLFAGYANGSKQHSSF